MKKIVIVGGGIGGLTLAIALKKAGFTCEVYERSPEFREVGAAVSLWPNALRVFRELGILEAVLEKCGEIKEAYIKTAAGKVLTRSRPAYDLPAVCIHRADLLSVLLQQVPADWLHPGHELHEFAWNENGTVTATFSNGKEVLGDLLVGADGINSRVRQKIIGDGKPIYRGYTIWRGIAEVPLDQGYASETLGRGNRVGIVPIREGQFGWWATANEPFGQVDEPEGTLVKLKRIFGQWHDPIPRLFDHSPHIIKTNLGDRIPVRGWSKGNVVLIGDAAHPTTPNLGQGACMAIEGVLLLSHCLVEYGISEKALKVYEEKHYPRAQEIVKNSLLLGQIGQWQHPVLAGIRNLFFTIQPEAASLKVLDRYFGYDVTKVPV
ncbi:NAD(P)/FAD-dependent oxidoreductase [Rhabdobacter roseus]|uniref:2-polyprenyl-6-methoxyphenol hydroxylase-like FAD-dependent oxidoreductase n=1 Tax=Rhabdobacter roseus TaxID=1655419 RepID=A0A840TMG7_9BACT|nr:FAD-dependent monooxygenase [Rhabdobacter roseus]MBB5285446.1 2-polyprenyl-6-methoxyphenol hydroxylase-like FAD-dependent oxidoreductase [Rhabdobacter roseus]